MLGGDNRRVDCVHEPLLFGPYADCGDDVLSAPSSDPLIIPVGQALSHGVERVLGAESGNPGCVRRIREVEGVPRRLEGHRPRFVEHHLEVHRRFPRW